MIPYRSGTSLPDPAPLWRRVAACGLDFAVVVLLFGVVVYFRIPEDAVEGATARDLVGFVLPVLLLILPVTLVYFTAFETWRGQTPGKKALGIRVEAVGGGRASFMACFTRNLLRLLYEAGFLGVLFFLLDLLCVEWTEMDQRLGDMAAGTVVVMAAGAATAVEVPPAQPPKAPARAGVRAPSGGGR
ncbi:MAG TPA: RDD family protein [Candidatus Thermoplasmatota archaeon]|nr:RDD family protein [Candidatus Thermoplasmatota archaeon]